MVLPYPLERLVQVTLKILRRASNASASFSEGGTMVVLLAYRVHLLFAYYVVPLFAYCAK